MFVADGRFHLEAIMIANPTIPAFRYDPYGRNLIAEQYDQEGERRGGYARHTMPICLLPSLSWTSGYYHSALHGPVCTLRQ